MKGFQRARRTDGAVLVEAAITLPLFLIVVLISFDFFVVGFHALSLQYTANRSVRWALLGEVLSDPLDTSSSPEQLSRVDSIKLKAQQIGGVFGLHVTPEQVRVCVLPGTTCPPDDAGTSNDLFSVAIIQPVDLLVGFQIEIKSLAVSKIE